MWPENSVEAVAAARDVGADGVEFDLWLSADKSLVVHHDRTVEGHAIPTTTFEQLREKRPVAQLGDVLEAAEGMRINVEIKPTRSAPYNLTAAHAVATFLDESPLSDQCLVSSFSLDICDEVRRDSPTRRVGWLVKRHPAQMVLDQVVRSGLTSAHFPFSRVNPAVADRARALGIELHVWTPNLRRDIDRMLDLGVGAVITDDVILAQELRAHHRPTAK
jgi:glycerophosphoryl diester phosphodiesterase